MKNLVVFVFSVVGGFVRYRWQQLWLLQAFWVQSKGEVQSMDLVAWVFWFGQRGKGLGFLAAWLREGKQRGRRRQGS